MQDCQFQNLVVTLFGGAIQVTGTSGSKMSITGSLFSNCSAASGGGAVTVAHSAARVAVTSCRFRGCLNHSWGCTQIQFEGSVLDVFNSTITEIESSRGIIETYGESECHIVSCEIFNLHISGTGGALFLMGRFGAVEDSSFRKCTVANILNVGAAL